MIDVLLVLPGVALAVFTIAVAVHYARLHAELDE